MKIYYLLLEGKPYTDNGESKEVLGAYINCWVKAKNKKAAEDLAIEYISSEGWETLNIEEMWIAEREQYVDEPDSLEFYDQAVAYGAGAVFYTWSIDDNDDIDVIPRSSFLS